MAAEDLAISDLKNVLQEIQIVKLVQKVGAGLSPYDRGRFVYPNSILAVTTCANLSNVAGRFGGGRSGEAMIIQSIADILVRILHTMFLVI